MTASTDARTARRQVGRAAVDDLGRTGARVPTGLSSRDLVARFGGIPLRHDRRAVIRDPAPVLAAYPRKELIHRLRKRECELCETSATVTVHQVTGLKKLGRPGPGQPAWAMLMARMRRKTLIVCRGCHEHIHANPVAHTA